MNTVDGVLVINCNKSTIAFSHRQQPESRPKLARVADIRLTEKDLLSLRSCDLNIDGRERYYGYERYNQTPEVHPSLLPERCLAAKGLLSSAITLN